MNRLTEIYEKLILGQGMLCVIYEGSISPRSKLGKKIRGILPTFYLFYEFHDGNPIPERLLKAYGLYVSAIKSWKSNNYYIFANDLFELNKLMAEIAKSVVVNES